MISLLVAALLTIDGGEEVDATDGGALPEVEVADAGFVSEPDVDAGTELPVLEESVADAGAPVAEPKILSTVVVGTTEERTAGSVHTIKASRLKRFGLDDPGSVLQAVPGVYSRTEDGFGLRPNIGLRGANSDRSKKVTLMEDGVLFGPAPYSAPAAYYFPLVARMETARVIKGPAAVLYGPSTVGGAVDLITRDVPTGVLAGADLAYGQYNYGKLHGWFGASNETSGFLLEAVHIRSDGFKELDGGGNTGFSRTEVMAKARHAFSLGPTRHVLGAKLTFAFEDSNETYLGLSDQDFAANPLRRYASSAEDRMSNHREGVVFSHRVSAGEVTLTTTAYAHFFSRVWRRLDHLVGASAAEVLAAPTRPRNMIYYGVLSGQLDSATPEEQLVIANNDRRFTSAGVQAVLRAPFTTGPLSHAVEFQARYHYDSARRHHTGERYDMRSGRLLRADVPTQDLLHNLDDTKALALSAIDAVRIGPVTITPGLRFELIRSRSHDRMLDTLKHGATNAWLPGVGAHWSIIPELGVLAGVYRGFTPAVPGGEAQPEYSVNYEAGARWARRGERLEAVGFFNDYSNLTSICTLSAGCTSANLDRQFNAGRAHIYGLEAYGEKTLRFAGVVIPITAAYTFTQTSLLESFSSQDPQLGDVREGDELPYVPKHQLNVSAGVDVWRISAHAQLNFIDRMREVAGQGMEGPLTDPLLTVDLHLGFRVFDWLRLYADARNVGDSRVIVARRPFGARPNAPRTFIAGIKVDY